MLVAWIPSVEFPDPRPGPRPDRISTPSATGPMHIPMVWDSTHLQTRQYVRRAAEISARLEFHSDQAEQIRFAFADSQNRIVVTDVSEGGIGLRTEVFLPRNARLTVRVRSEAEGSELVIQAVVRRCQMIDLKPAYHIGLQFLETPAADRQALLKLVQDAGALDPEIVAPPDRADPQQRKEAAGGAHAR